MNIANSGMRAMQESVNTASNNIANAQTEGYARKRVNLVTNVPQQIPGIGEISTGVRTEGVMRIRDAFIDTQVRLETSRYETFASQNEVNDQLEIIFSEPSSTGISAAMRDTWNAWQELSKTPESTTSRTLVLEQSVTLADRFNHTASQLKGLESDILNQISQNVFEVNTRLEQLKAVDEQIMESVNRGIAPNDLMDQRDLMLDQLSGFVTFEVQENQDGGISLKTNGIELIRRPANDVFSVVQSTEMIPADGDEPAYVSVILAAGGSSNELRTLMIPASEYEGAEWKVGSAVVTSRETQGDFLEYRPVEFSIGRIQGLQSMLDETAGYARQLDEVASGLAGLVNQVYGEDSGTEFFTAGDDSGVIRADNIRVNQELRDDPWSLQAGKDLDGPAGDGSRALAVAALRNVGLNTELSTYDPETMSFTASNGESADGRYRALVTQLGVSSNYSRSMQDNETALLNQLHQRRESVMGVSIDEEIAALIKFQNGYQANARVMSTLVTMLDTLINMGR